MLELFSALTFGYLLGSIPIAALVARAAGKDIFTTGSGNMGAMNTARNVGWIPGAVVLILDVLKGLAAVLGAAWLADAASTSGFVRDAMPYLAALGAILGHAWSVFARFLGGKALATTLGISLGLFPLAGLYTLLLLLGFLLITKRSTLSSIVAISLYPVVVALLLNRAGVAPELWFMAITVTALVAVVVVIKHLVPNRPRARKAS